MGKYCAKRGKYAKLKYSIQSNEINITIQTNWYPHNILIHFDNFDVFPNQIKRIQ